MEGKDGKHRTGNGEQDSIWLMDFEKVQSNMYWKMLCIVLIWIKFDKVTKLQKNSPSVITNLIEIVSIFENVIWFPFKYT
jgi:ABC-type xylose transport system permease subunit